LSGHSEPIGGAPQYDIGHETGRSTPRTRHTPHADGRQEQAGAERRPPLFRHPPARRGRIPRMSALLVLTNLPDRPAAEALAATLVETPGG